MLSSGPKLCAAVRDQVKSATPNTGMSTIFAKKIQRNVGTLMERKGRKTSHRIAKLSNPGASMFALAGKAPACHHCVN